MPLVVDETGQEYAQIRRDLYDFVEKVVEKYPNNGHIETEKHWEAALKLYEIWQKFYPHEFKHFAKTQKQLKGSQLDKYGSVKEGDAEIQHVVEIPATYYKLLKGLFSQMQYDPVKEEWRARDIDDQLRDKKFLMKFVKRIPLLKIPDKI